MKVPLLTLAGIVCTLISCELQTVTCMTFPNSPQCIPKKVHVEKEETPWGIMSVRFYSNANPNIEPYFPGKEYIEAEHFGKNDFLIIIPFYTLVREDKKYFSLVPNIAYVGDSITPENNDTITKQITPYTVIKKGKKKTYRVLVIIDRDTIPIINSLPPSR